MQVMVIPFLHSAGGIPFGQVFGQGKDIRVARGNVVVIIRQQNVVFLRRAIRIGKLEMKLGGAFGAMSLATLIWLLPESWLWFSGSFHGRPQTPVTEGIAFIRSSVGSARECGIVSRHQSVYFAETHLVSSIRGPGQVEILLQSQLDSANQQLREARAEHLFVNREFLPGGGQTLFAPGLACALGLPLLHDPARCAAVSVRSV